MMHTVIGIKRAYPRNYTLDFDALASSYIWAPEIFTFYPGKQLVTIDTDTGVTYGARPGLECWNLTLVTGPSVPCQCHVCHTMQQLAASMLPGGTPCAKTKTYTCGSATVANSIYTQGFYAKLAKLLTTAINKWPTSVKA